jgi:uncharacterized protein (TIGR01655 family)
MKRKWIAVLCLSMTFVVAYLFGIVASKEPRRFKSVYYTKVITSTPTDNGSCTFQYEYRLPSYTAEGIRRELDFTAPKILRLNAYLRVYAASEGSVTAWEEVQPNEVPPKAAEQLR